MGNLAEIARHTGLGVTTVSEILRNKPGYREQTRQTVIAAAEQLNYRPNLVARGLKAGRSKTIGVVIGSFNTPSAINKIADIERTAQAAGYTTFVTQGMSDEPGSTISVIENLLARQIDGLIVSQRLSPGKAVLHRLQQSKTPTVYIDWAPAGASNQVVFDRQIAMNEAAAHLAQLGHARATFVGTPSDRAYPELKINGWRAAFAGVRMSLDVDERYFLAPSADYPQQVYEMIRQRAKEAALPTVLLVNNDTCAIAAIAGLTEMGISVPEDISIVGFDDLPEVRYTRPGLTTIRQPRSEVGETAFAMLLRAMDEAQPEAKSNAEETENNRVCCHEDTQADGTTNQRVVMACRFVQRQSTGPSGST